MFIRHRIVTLAVVAMTATSLAGCAFFDELGAARTFKEANIEYSRGRYAEAIELYKEVLAVLDETGAESDLARELRAAYFYTGNSYDSIFLPGNNEPDNLNNLEQAVSYYELASEESPSEQLRELSMQYLVSTFGSDKANDPARAEPVLREMILADPENPDNYYRLAQLYEESGLYEEAEFVYQAVERFRGDDPDLYLQIAGFYHRAGEFERTMEALEERGRVDPENPEAFYTISTYYWEKAFRDFRISQDQKLEYIMAGIDAADRALGLNERYVDALVYKNILLRLQANETEDLDERDALIAQADELRDRAVALQEEQRGGAPPAA